MTVIELLQCFGWGTLAAAPILTAHLSGYEIGTNREGAGALIFAFILQIAALVCAFKAGGV